MEQVSRHPREADHLTTICQVIDFPLDIPLLRGIAAHHDRSRFRHIVAALGPKNEAHARLEREGVKVFALGACSRTGYPAAMARLVSLLRREHVNIVQTHLFEPSLLGLLGGRLARVPAVVVTRHHSDFTTLMNKPVHRWLDRQQALRADLVMAVSAAVRRSMVELEHVPTGRIVVCPHGYDFDELRPSLISQERDELRRALGVPDSGPLLAVVARLCPLKGHQYLFRALPELLVDWPGLRVVLAGGGPHQQDLERQVASEGLAGVVSFLGHRPDAQRIMEAADIVVHPTLTEAFSHVIIEAMALERPLVATDVAAAPEQVDTNETGVLVPARDPKAMAAAIRSLLVDPGAATEMGREARRRVVDRFSFPKMIGLYEEVYDRALTVRRASWR